MKRTTRAGPESSRRLATAPIGTMAPEAERVFRLAMSAMSSRDAGSAWAVTRKVRPSRLKSLM
ncbi:hypothetical protein D3C85_1067540 [compost metagenome]